MNTDLLRQEIRYRTARSGGKGGQNVNKVETKVEALLDVRASEALTDDEKTLVMVKLENDISKEGILSATNQTERSQLANKFLAEKKLVRMVQKALHREKERKATKVPPSVVAARKRDKRYQSEKKSARGKVKTHSDDGGFDLFNFRFDFDL